MEPSRRARENAQPRNNAGEMGEICPQKCETGITWIVRTGEIARVLGAMAEPEPLQAAKSLMSRLPPPPISRIQARINASRALTGQRYRRGVVPTATAELTDGKVHPDGQAEHSALVLADSPKGKKQRSKKSKKRKGESELEDEAEALEVGFEAATVIAKESCGTMTLGVRLSAAAPALRLGETPLSVDFYTVDVSKSAHDGSNIAADRPAFLCTLSSDCSRHCLHLAS